MRHLTPVSDQIASLLHEAGLAAIPVDASNTKTLQNAKGAYVLIVKMDAPIQICLPKQAPINLPAATYFYVGSANGPGGLQARLGRHFQQKKKVHWHVDQLTTKACSVSAIAVAGGNECDLGSILINTERFIHAVDGFGSSDCRTCDSHLFLENI